MSSAIYSIPFFSYFVTLNYAKEPTLTSIMNTNPCMSSHNKRIIILIYTKDCSDTEGYKNQTNFVSQKMAASEVLSAMH